MKYVDYKSVLLMYLNVFIGHYIYCCQLILVSSQHTIYDLWAKLLENQILLHAMDNDTDKPVNHVSVTSLYYSK